ncbi:uncharacterized protein KY384_006468 [Bacidia gigantensis]|uniref:uncharacterized protein n=1 Tax=Bacidia gigantensis TaxID=2732470 RepID=UPI001D04D767|nr:uncharacterized protein KY384_006468 [Bacidia gigantensis]KAG8528780.1 hypothetical protein KY384_006468 [Bacidia gigantensis]
MVKDEVKKALESVQKAVQGDLNGTGQAHVDLLETIRKLSLAVETPAETLMRMRFEPLQSAAIRLALETGVLDAISSLGGKKVTADELADLTKYHALLIARIMRLVTWAGVVDEVGENTYAANEMTRLIVSPGLSGGEKHHFDLFFPTGAKLMEYLHETKVHQFPKDDEISAFQYAHGKKLWEYFDAVPEQRKYFDDYMAVRRVGLVKWFQTYPMAEILCPAAKRDANAALFVDVGGNWGHEVESFHEAYPDAPGRLILQDLPQTIEKVRRENPPKDVECMEYDFFQPQPIKGARAYYFRNICHDWPDEQCQIFLSNTARSMEEGYSRLLIDDYVLNDVQAPIRAAAMDLLMMLFCSGIERTRHQWEILLDRCGLEIVKVWGTRSDYEQVIEARLKE